MSAAPGVACAVADGGSALEDPGAPAVGATAPVHPARAIVAIPKSTRIPAPFTLLDWGEMPAGSCRFARLARIERLG
jgi:hypothetical protein